MGAAILRWYDRAPRSFAWRIAPARAKSGAQADPYRVWLSEVMLQQTGVARAEPFFVRFTDRWPRVCDLARAPLAEVMKLWAGLGYYARARNLHACAQMVAPTGFPSDPVDLQKLPGIGPYTAAAIAAIAFDWPVAPVDVNIRRVVARLAAAPRGHDIAAWNKRIQESATGYLDRARPGDWAQAMMDFAARICLPNAPMCDACPVAQYCRAKEVGIVARVPGKPVTATRPLRRGAAFYLVDGAQALLVRRPPHGLLGGTLAVPSSPWREGEHDDLDAAPAMADWRRMGCVAHVFTHFSLRLDVWRADVSGPRPTGVWTDRAGIENAGLASVFQKVVRMADDVDRQTLAPRL